ncbi:MAG: hypothetical protein AAF211_15270 [Myxococcota bacterium]
MSAILALALTVPAQAQDADEKPEKEMKVLLTGRGTGGYGGPEFGVGLVGGRLATRLGGRAGWVATRSFVIGAFGEGISSTTGTGEPVRVVDGGVFLEGIIAPYQAVHASLEGGVGVGSVSWAGNGSVGVVPYAAARLDLNVVTWFRASVGPSVRGLVSSAVPTGTSRLSGGLDVVLKFGSF